MAIKKKDLLIAATGLFGIAAGVAWEYYKQHRKKKAAETRWQQTTKTCEELPPRTLHPIESICTRRGIQSLYHFTRISSLSSILEHGLLSHQDVKAMQLPLVDPNRHDGREDHICLTVSHPNSKMLYKLSHDDQSAWCVIELPASITWERECLFTPTNAANKDIQSIPEEELKGDAAFERMFMPQIGNCERSASLSPCYPTDVQAEVMCPGRISTNLFSAIYFYSEPPGELKRQARDRGIAAEQFGMMFWPRNGDEIPGYRYVR